MLSSTDGHEHYAADESRKSDPWAPWMDDRTTTTYHAQYLDYFRSRTQTAPQYLSALQLELIELPDEPFEMDQAKSAAVSGRQPPAARTGRQVVRRLDLGKPVAHASTLAGHAPPRKSAERTLSQGWHMAPNAPALTAALTPPTLELTEDENPFASTDRGVSFWVSSLAAGGGLFAAVLLGHILLRASVEPPAVQREPAPVAAPASEPVAPPLPAAAPPTAAAPLAAEPDPTPASGSAGEGARAHESGRGYGRRTERARSPESDSSDAASSAGAERTRSARARRASADDDAEPSPRSRRARDEDAEPTTHARRASDDAVAAPASSGAPGHLRINSRPWSQVSVDGQTVGHTPVLDLQVAPGSHTLRLVNPEFGLSKTVQVKVAPGESVTRVELLEP